MIDLTKATMNGRGDWKYWVMCRHNNYIIKCTDSEARAIKELRNSIEFHKEIGTYMYHDIVIITRYSKDDWRMIYGEDILGITYWSYVKYQLRRIKRILGL